MYFLTGVVRVTPCQLGVSSALFALASSFLIAWERVVVHSAIPSRLVDCQRVCLLLGLLGEELRSEYLVLGIQSLFFILDPGQVLGHLVKLLLCLLVVLFRAQLCILATFHALVLTLEHLARKGLKRLLLLRVQPINPIIDILPFLQSSMVFTLLFLLL